MFWKFYILGRVFFVLVLTLSFTLLSCETEKAKMNREFTEFLTQFEGKVKPLSKNANLAYFDASISGEDSLYQKAENLQVELVKIFADKEEFAHLKKIKESNLVTDPLLKRQLELIYNEYLGKQLDEEMLKQLIAMQTDIEKRFSVYRSEIDGKKYTDNQVEEILQTSHDSRKLEQAWKASKMVGKMVASDVLKLVKLRNEASPASVHRRRPFYLPFYWPSRPVPVSGNRGWSAGSPPPDYQCTFYILSLSNKLKIISDINCFSISSSNCLPRYSL